MSDYIYSTDEILRVEFMDGWRAGAVGQILESIGNHSAIEPELASARWAVPPFVYTSGLASRRLELVVASGLSQGLQAVAAVKFLATDGQQAKESWAFGPSDSTGWGDKLRCWGVNAAELFEGLQPGPVTVHFELYPWIGKVRRSGQEHATQAGPALSLAADRPLVVFWDPTGDVLPELHVYVSPTGVSNPALVTVASSIEGARAGVHARDVSTAAAAIAAVNRTLPTLNRWPGGSRCVDNAVITLSEGRHGFGAASIPTNAATRFCRLIIQGDPDLQRSSELELGQRPRWPFRFVELRNMIVSIGRAQFPDPLSVVHFQNAAVRVSDLGSSRPRSPFTGSAAEWRLSIMSSDWDTPGLALDTVNLRCGLVRSSFLGQSVAAPLVVNCRHDGRRRPGFRLSGVVVPGHPEATDDTIFMSNLLLGLRGRALSTPGRQISGNPTHQLLCRLRLVNNLFEMALPDGAIYNGNGNPPVSDPHYALGENSWTVAVDCLFEGNTFVGQRCNLLYNDPPTADPQLQLWHIGNTVRNNVFDRNSTKHDAFSDPKFGQRPGFVKAWSVLYGVRRFNNAILNRMGTTTSFAHEFFGIGQIMRPVGSLTDGNSWVKFENDLSQLSLSPQSTGGGDYRPRPDSPLVGRASEATLDVDALGVSRHTAFAIGAFEPRHE
ncbi:MAG: hypothetical protein RMK78_04225 [Thermaurantiacus sp.]|nr:hypothetical protein [Thermaurantiacus sp.]